MVALESPGGGCSIQKVNGVDLELLLLGLGVDSDVMQPKILDCQSKSDG